MRRLWRWWAGRGDSGEICHDPGCLRELRWRELWESREHLANLAEMGPLGGTWMTGYWCSEHAPDGAVPWRP